MEVTFSNKKLAKLCNSEQALRAECGQRMAKVIKRRLADLAAAANVEEMTTIFTGRCHQLTANLKGQFAVDLEHPARLIFRPNHNPLPERADGSLDLSNVTHVEIVRIEDDYHKK
jgi:toxin HigB-1